MPPNSSLPEMGRAARAAAHRLGNTRTDAKHQALHNIAEDLLARQAEIIRANRLDYAAGEAQGLGAALLDRLLLDAARLGAIAADVRAVAALPDPVGETIEQRSLENGLRLSRRRVPLAPAVELGADRVVVVGTGSLRPAEPDPEADLGRVDLGDSGATLLGAVMDDPLRHDLRRLASLNELVADDAVRAGLDEHRARLRRPPYRVTPYAAVAPHTGTELAEVAMTVFRANHGLTGSLRDPDLQLVHRLLGSDSPLQGEMLSYLLFDPDFFEAAADLGRREAEEWLEHNPDLWRTGPLAALTE